MRFNHRRFQGIGWLVIGITLYSRNKSDILDWISVGFMIIGTILLSIEDEKK